MAFAQAAQKNCNWQTDVAVPDAPTDSISAISFSPVSNHLAASSWDNSVRIYQVGNRASEGAQRVGEFKHDAPVLDVCWSHDASKIFSSGVDNSAKAYDVSTGQASTVAMHGAPIKAVRWTEMHNGLLVTAGWDNALQV
jgi:mRNA export factor